jgi:short-subunit dehydrogenase
MKTVLITGASRGLGRELATEFVQHNYNLILHCKASEMPMTASVGLGYEEIKGDIIAAQTLSRLAEVAKQQDIDILINNAGIYLNKALLTTPDIDIRNVLEVNLIAPMLLTRRILPIFQKKKSGLVININSVAGKSWGKGETAYCASKFGLRGFSQCLQYEVEKDNIRVIDVFLGAMKTDMTKNRSDFENLIDPGDAAQIIFGLCKEYPSASITEIDIGRREY